MAQILDAAGMLRKVNPRVEAEASERRQRAVADLVRSTRIDLEPRQLFENKEELMRDYSRRCARGLDRELAVAAAARQAEEAAERS